MGDDFTLMTTDSMLVQLNADGCCVKHPQVKIREKTSSGEVYQKESCEACDAEYAQQQSELREQRAELKRQLKELNSGKHGDGGRRRDVPQASSGAAYTAASSSFGGPPPPSQDNEAYSSPSMLSLDGLAMQMNRMQQMQDWILNQKEAELQLLRTKYDEQQRELMRKEVEIALLKEKLNNSDMRMEQELKLARMGGYSNQNRGDDGTAAKNIHIGELHVSVKENASPEELANATEDAFQEHMKQEEKKEEKKDRSAAIGAGVAAGAGVATGAAVAAAATMPHKTVTVEAPGVKKAPAEPPQMRKSVPTYPDQDDGPELIDDVGQASGGVKAAGLTPEEEKLPESFDNHNSAASMEGDVEKMSTKPAPVERKSTPVYVPAAAGAAVGAAAVAGTMAVVSEDEDASEAADKFETKDLSDLGTGKGLPEVSQIKDGPRGSVPKELTVDPAAPGKVPLTEQVTMATVMATDYPDDMTMGQTVASSTYEEDRVKVTNRNITDPYGDEGTFSGVVLASTGMPHGVGRMVYKDDGRIYEGDWRHGRWHGFGKASFANGDSFEGQYRFDQRHGRGKYAWNDGREYDGIFHEDKRQGKGTFRWPDGALYNGDFNHGQREGHGKYIFADGGYYEGEWLDGRYNGYGVCKWSDGRAYDGEWKQGMAHGSGRETLANGDIRHDGQWDEDEPIRSGE